MKFTAPLLLLASWTTSAIAASTCKSGFYLHNAANDERLACIVHREKINLADYGLDKKVELNVEFDASSLPGTSSVQFLLNREIKRCENEAPYFLDGNDGEDVLSSTRYTRGQKYKTKAIVYDGPDCTGTKLSKHRVRFELVHKPVDSAAP